MKEDDIQPIKLLYCLLSKMPITNRIMFLCKEFSTSLDNLKEN